MATKGLPRPKALNLSKGELLKSLAALDESVEAQKRVKQMEDDFRKRIATHLTSLSNVAQKPFRDYNTNPFVLLFYSSQQKFTRVDEIECVLVPAKVFSSMETSAGRMVERVVLPPYGWDCVDSGMHTTDSVVDGSKLDGDTLRIVTLKSGPRCINDSMTGDIARELVDNAPAWAKKAKVKKVEFTVGVLYGTRKKSNKKDWHILRRACEIVTERANRSTSVMETPADKWQCRLKIKGVEVTARVELGESLWSLVGSGHDAFTELLCAAVRSCIDPSNSPKKNVKFQIPDLGKIIELTAAQKKTNFTVLQKSQVEWFLLMAAHFAEGLTE